MYTCICYVCMTFSSVAQSCPTLCDPMDCPPPGLPVHHQLPELAYIHSSLSWDAIQLSRPLSSPSPLDFNLSQHQGLFQWVGSSGGQSIGVSASASVLPMNIQDWSPLGWTGWISLQSKGLSRVFSNTTVQKHQFFGAQPVDSRAALIKHPCVCVVCVCMFIAQLCQTLCNPMDCNPPGSSLRGILQARTLERVAIPFSRRSSRNGTWLFAVQANSLLSEPPKKPWNIQLLYICLWSAGCAPEATVGAGLLRKRDDRE